MTKIRVPSKGPLECKIAFIGEAPGATECNMGEPFVPSAPAGELFTTLLNGALINRGICFITNVFKERIGKIKGKSDIIGFMKFRQKTVDTTPAYQAYEKELHDELSRCTANVIVPMGAAALWAICRKVGIQKWRGSILSCEISGKMRKVIPTIHPAAALQYGGKARTSSGRSFSPYLYRYYTAMDLLKVVRESEFPEVRLIDRYLRVEPSLLDIRNFIDVYNHPEGTGFDIETDYSQISHISLSPSKQHSMSIPFIQQGREYMTAEDEASVWQKVANLLESDKVRKIAQNAMFDCTYLYERYGIIVNNLEDTMIAHAILYPDLHRSLDFLTSMYTDVPYYSEEGKAKFGGKYVSDKAFSEYNATDSIVLHEIWERLEADLISTDNMETYKRTRDMIYPLIYMQARGMKVDIEALEDEKIKLRSRTEGNSELFKSQCGYDINPDSPAQVMEYFYEKKRIKAYVKQNSDGTYVPTVDQKALKRLAGRGFVEARTLLEFRRDTKLLRTYLEIKLDNDGRLRCFFNPAKAVTGRLTSSTSVFGTGTNVQNLPPDMRRFIVADEGYILCSLDLEQVENRIVAYIAPELKMIQAFENGVDIHRQTAGMIFGKPASEISDEPGSSSIGGGLLSERHWGKEANHGLNYNIGIVRMALEWEIKQTEARFIKDAYMTSYPGIPRFHQWEQEQLAIDRTLTNLMGRKRTFKDRWGVDLFNAAYDWIPQSSVGDIINERGVLYVYRNQNIFKPVELLNQIHDEIVLQIPISCGWERVAQMLRAIRGSLEIPLYWKGRHFIIPVGLKVGLNFKNKDKDNPQGMVKVEFNEMMIQRLKEVYKTWTTES